MTPTPVAELSKLSLSSSMSPVSRRRSQHSSRGQPRVEDLSSSEESDSGSSGLSDEEDEDPAIIRSPSKLTYRINDLSPEVRSAVRDAYRDPPKITLHYCRQRDNVYAFQMTEVVHRSIRIGSADSTWPFPRCSCGKTTPPCRHVLWLMDRLAGQALYNHEASAPLTLTPQGFPAEIGHPFQCISNFHLNLLADSLHCELTTPDSEEEEDEGEDEDEDRADLSSYRVLEAREILASVADLAPEKYRPDLFAKSHRGKKPLKRGDLECTVFRMLLDNVEFFNYFLSLTRSTDPVNDPFRRLSRRVASVLSDLDAYSTSLSLSQTSSPATATSPGSFVNRNSPAESPCDVPWAAHHILGVISLIHAQLSTTLPPPRRLSAARTLIRILSAVSDRNYDAHPGPSPQDRNLYVCLIAHRDQDFVIPLLSELLDAAAPFVHNLEVVQDRIGVHGAPDSYVSRFGELVDRLRAQPQARSSPPGSGARRAGSKRQGQGGQGRDSKRVK